LIILPLPKKAGARRGGFLNHLARIFVPFEHNHVPSWECVTDQASLHVKEFFLLRFPWLNVHFFSQISGQTVGEVRAVADMHQRKAEMARQSDAFIALPGESHKPRCSLVYIFFTSPGSAA
jgi:hypothetical protein